MLTKDDLDSLRGITIVEAEIHERDHPVRIKSDGLNLGDESSMP